jgi:hypothetical protein
VQYWFRVFSIAGAVSAIIELAFWITDLLEGRPFHGGWQLASSIIWTPVFFYLSRRQTDKK